jgi:hypothetical protein
MRAETVAPARTEFLSRGTALPNMDGVSVVVPANTDAPPAKADLKVSPRTKSLWISGGLYAAGGLVGGLIKLGLRKWLPSYGSAATPLVNVGTQVAMSPGQQAIQLVTGPISVWGYNWVRGKEQTTLPSGIHGIDAEYSNDLIGVYGKRSRMDNWVSDPVSNFGGYQQAFEISLHGVRRKLDAKDIDSAARLLGSTLFFDRQIWSQHSHESANVYEVLFIALHPYLEGLDASVIEDLKKRSIAEAVRLDGGKDQGLAKYVDAMITGVATDGPAPAMIAPWSGKAVSEHDMTESTEWAQSLIKSALDEQLQGKTWWESRRIKGDFNRAMRDTMKQLKDFESQTGHPATADELWRMVTASFAKDAGRKLETKAALISVGAFALLAGGATFGYAHLAKTLPHWVAPGFDTIAPTIISYLTVVARFGIEKFVAFGRALGWAGAAPATLGVGLDRDFRNIRVRTAMVDRRAIGLLGLFNSFTRRIQHHVIDASDMVRAGKIDRAAAELAGMTISANTTSYYFWPFSKLLHRVFERCGPYFDDITATQRDELIAKTLERVRKSGASDDLIAVFHKPFIEGLLTRNVRLGAGKPAPLRLVA